MKLVSFLLVAFCIGLSAGATIQNDTVAVPQAGLSVGQRAISGTVSDHTGQPVIGAIAKVADNKDINTVTDVDGNFNLAGAPDSCTLDISAVGYQPLQVAVTPGKDVYAAVLDEAHSALDEVVVVGYATQKKVNVTGSVASVSVNALADRPITNATNALAGLAAGLTVSNSGGNTPGYESQSILVRGQGTLNNSAPLVVVDGMTGIAISDINPQDIENISVLKDAASAAIYGSRAANGVILVTTRQGSERAPRVTYSGNVSFEKVAKRLNLVTDYADFMEIQNYYCPLNHKIVSPTS